MSRRANKNSRSGKSLNSETAASMAESERVLDKGGAALADDQLDFTIGQDRIDPDRLFGEIPEPLTVRSIIDQIEKISRTNATLTKAERAFLADFVAASDRGSFIENSFLRAAVEGGKTLKADSWHMPDEDEDAGWIGLHRFFRMYVVNHTHYGEGQNDFGPFAKQKDGKAAFDVVVALWT